MASVRESSPNMWIIERAETRARERVSLGAHSSETLRTMKILNQERIEFCQLNRIRSDFLPLKCIEFHIVDFTIPFRIMIFL